MTVIVTDGTDKEYIEYESGCDLKKWMHTPGGANLYMSSSMVGSVARSTKPNDARG